MRLSDEQYEFIKGEVVALFERYDVRCIPISGFELAYKMGITLISYSALTEKQRSAAMRISTDGFYVEDPLGSDSIYYHDGDGISYLKGGKAPEKAAYASGDSLEEYIRGKR